MEEDLLLPKCCALGRVRGLHFHFHSHFPFSTFVVIVVVVIIGCCCGDDDDDDDAEAWWSNKEYRIILALSKWPIRLDTQYRA